MPTFEEIATRISKSRVGNPERFRYLLNESFQRFGADFGETMPFVVLYSRLTTPAFWVFASITLLLTAQQRSLDDKENGERVIKSIIREHATLPPKVVDILNKHGNKVQWTSESWRRWPALQIIEICHSLVIDIHKVQKQRDILLLNQYTLLTVSRISRMYAFLAHVRRLL